MRSLRSFNPGAVTRRRRLAAGAVAAAFALAACGGGSSDDAATGAQSSDPIPEVTDGETDEAPAPAASGAGLVDLVGADVVPEAEVETNVLPSVVVDDVTNGRKVNFRNLVPQEKPILLWMWAPH